VTKHPFSLFGQYFKYKQIQIILICTVIRISCTYKTPFEKNLKGVFSA